MSDTLRPAPAPDGGGTVLVLGETMAAFRSDGLWRLGARSSLTIAGAESNVAIGIARLGWRARWVGVVGADEFGALVLRTLRAEGVDVSAARVEQAAPTGLIFFEHRMEGAVRVTYRRSGSAGSTLRAEDVDAAFGDDVALLVVSGITPALGAAPREAVHRALELARGAAVPVVFDVNFRATLWPADEAAPVLGELASHADVVVASEDELALLAPPASAVAAPASEAVPPPASAVAAPASKAAAPSASTAVPAPGKQAATTPGNGAAAAEPESSTVGSLLGAGRREVVVKRGAAGASLFLAGGSWHRSPPAVDAVDPVGAGDAFVAGYCTAMLEGLPPEARLGRAVRCGAFAVATRGDWEGLPRRDELRLLELPPGGVQR